MTSVDIPRPGTAARRVWLLRGAANVGLPVLAVVLGWASLVAAQSARQTGAQEIAGAAWFGLALLAAAGIAALVDPRTRLAGGFALALAILCSPPVLGYIRTVAGLL